MEDIPSNPYIWVSHERETISDSLYLCTYLSNSSFVDIFICYMIMCVGDCLLCLSMHILYVLKCLAGQMDRKRQGDKVKYKIYI